MLVWLVTAVFAVAADGFVRLDADRSGSLDVAEIGSALGNQAQAGSLIGMFDVDGDKAWSRAEFDAWAKSLREGPLSVPLDAFAIAPSILSITKAAFEIDDRDDDGKLSVGELSGGAEMLRQLDADGDGSLNVDEFALTSFGSLDIGAIQTMRGLIGIADAGQDGRFGKGELERAVRLLPRDLELAPPPAVDFDADGDGVLGGREVDAWIAHGAARRLFDWVDTSKNGSLDATEISVRLAASMEASRGAIQHGDTNKDGGLDEAEFVAWRKSIRGY